MGRGVVYPGQIVVYPGQILGEWGRLPSRERFLAPYLAEDKLDDLRRRVGRGGDDAVPEPAFVSWHDSLWDTNGPWPTAMFAESLEEIRRNEFDPPILSKIPSINRLFKSVGSGRATSNPPQYGRPSFSEDSRLFTDLILHAPGLNSSRADIEAVLEAEARTELGTSPGHIDPEARQLIDQARAASLAGADDTGPGRPTRFPPPLRRQWPLRL